VTRTAVQRTIDGVLAYRLFHTDASNIFFEFIHIYYRLTFCCDVSAETRLHPSISTTNWMSSTANYQPLCLRRKSAFLNKWCDHIWSRRDLDLWPVDLEVYSVHLCCQMHLSCKFDEMSTAICVHKLLVYDHGRTHRRPENSMPSGCGNHRWKHIKSGFQRGAD